MRLLLLTLTITAICLSCKKEKVQAGENVEIYLLKTVQLVTGKCQIDSSASVIQDTPFVKNQDILEYSKANYQFALLWHSQNRDFKLLLSLFNYNVLYRN
jgi:hypothetical protein